MNIVLMSVSIAAYEAQRAEERLPPESPAGGAPPAAPPRLSMAINPESGAEPASLASLPPQAGAMRLPAHDGRSALPISFRQTANQGPDLTLLVRRMSRQDRQALAAFYELTVSRVFGLVAYVLPEEECMEEVVGAVFLEAWETSAACAAEPAGAWCWLLKLGRRTAVAHRQTCPRCAAAQASSRWAADAAATEDAGRLLDAFDKGSAEYAALAALSPLQREVLLLSLFGEMSCEAIAARLSLPAGRVWDEFGAASRLIHTQLRGELLDS